jgi:prolyl oligopeptidase
MNSVLVSLLLAAIMTALPACSTVPPDIADDPYLWLEEVQGDQALDWVRARNRESRAALEQHPRFEATRTRILELLDSRDKIPYVSRRGEWLYNLWQDAAQPRGLWRRTTLDEYRKAQPTWQTVLDLDALATAEKENWVWKGATCLGPSYQRCLLSLSRGGADAVVMREFDTVARRFVDAKDGGFVLPEAKGSVTWIDGDTLFVSTDFGPGSMTDSGYPRLVKRWRRGTPLAAAQTVFEGEPGDVSAFVDVDHTPGFERAIVGRHTDFYNSKQWLLLRDGTLRAIDYPSDAQFSFWRERVLVELKSDWSIDGRTWPRGSLLAADADA